MILLAQFDDDKRRNAERMIENRRQNKRRERQSERAEEKQERTIFFTNKKITRQPALKCSPPD